MGNSHSYSGRGGEESYVTRDIRSHGNGQEPRPEDELANCDDEEVEVFNRKSHGMRQAPKPSLSSAS